MADSPKGKRNKSKRPSKPIPEDDNSGDLLIAEEVPSKSRSPSVLKASPVAMPPSNKKRRKRDSASSDEERWLTAIESGKLEDVDDELKKIKPKDPSLMTARQRAMYDRGADTNTLMSLPNGYKEKVMTAEAIQKAAIKSQKRKQLADEKREKDKKKTMERLLKKQESKAAKNAKTKVSRMNVPTIVYRQNLQSTLLTFPPGVDWPLEGAKIAAPKKQYCAMGCGNVKKYSCSRTNVPLCSLKCYKQNITSRIF